MRGVAVCLLLSVAFAAAGIVYNYHGGKDRGFCVGSDATCGSSASAWGGE